MYFTMYQSRHFFLFLHLKINPLGDSKVILPKFTPVLLDGRILFLSYIHSKNSIQQIFIKCQLWAGNFVERGVCSVNTVIIS